MKTNQIMIRPMGEFKVTQRTKDAFFNATELLKQWNQLKGMKKEVNDYFGLSSTKEFIYTIMERENYDRGNYLWYFSYWCVPRQIYGPVRGKICRHTRWGCIDSHRYKNTFTTSWNYRRILEVCIYMKVS